MEGGDLLCSMTLSCPRIFSRRPIIVTKYDDADKRLSLDRGSSSGDGQSARNRRRMDFSIPKAHVLYRTFPSPFSSSKVISSLSRVVLQTYSRGHFSTVQEDVCNLPS